MKFYLYNTLSNEKEEFISTNDKKVNMYCCGPTVYNYAHIGNLRTYIFEDILRKSLEFNGYSVNHVMNITDVGHLESDSDSGEDKMSLASQRENRSVWDIARYYEDAFFKDCKELNIERPKTTSRATEHIEDMIKLIKVLEKKGYTYISNGNMYFSIDKFPKYNELAKLNLEKLEAGSRIEVDENKKNPFDFVLWFTNSKFANQIMQWDSPWGRGFPGWHLECSAMALKYLGENLDIHCGGVDHIPVHHTNEIAQSEGAIGHKWVNYWMHGEFLVTDGEKMSKSSGEFLTLNRLKEKGFSSIEYRYLCLQARYRKQLVFSFETMEDVKRSYKSLKNKVLRIKEDIKEEQIDASKVNGFIYKFKETINDDVNIPNSLSVLFEVIKSVELNSSEKIYLIKEMEKVLSLDLLEGDNDNNIDEKYILKRITERNEARREKNWSLSDAIRDELKAIGVELLDSKEGTTWRKA